MIPQRVQLSVPLALPRFMHTPPHGRQAAALTAGTALHCTAKHLRCATLALPTQVVLWWLCCITWQACSRVTAAEHAVGGVAASRAW